jgi:hypothetical protein
MNRRPNEIRGTRGAGVLPAVAAAGLLACNGCTAPAARPAWVDQPGSGRPEARYLSAVGSGLTRADAEDAALARLAQQIAVSVDARETARSWYASETGQGAPSSHQRLRLDRSIDLDTGVVLLGADVVETWQQRRDLFFALAVLDRAAAARAYDEQIERLAGQVRARRTSSQQAGSSWSAFVHLGAALPVAREHDRLIRVRSIISPWPVIGTGTQLLAPGIEAERHRLASRLAAVVEPAPGTPAGFDAIVREALRDAGVPVGGQQPASVRARVGYEAAERPFVERRDHVVEWRVTIELVDGETGRAAGGLTLDGDGWGKTRADASAAAAHQARHRLSRELGPFLRDLLSPAGGPPAEAQDVRSSTL